MYKVYKVTYMKISTFLQLTLKLKQQIENKSGIDL